MPYSENHQAYADYLQHDIKTTPHSNFPQSYLHRKGKKIHANSNEKLFNKIIIGLKEYTINFYIYI